MLGFGPATALGDESGVPSFMGALFGVGAVIFLPILYGAFGLIGGAYRGGTVQHGCRVRRRHRDRDEIVIRRKSEVHRVA
jgi:hypothetical protein